MRDEHDPWNLWVYRIGIEGSLEGESFQQAYNLEGRANANRVSEEHKISFNFEANYFEEKFEDPEDSSSFTNIQEFYAAHISSVWSLTPHWSFGLSAEASRSTFWNRDLAIFAGPVLEYNIYPYSESTRRAIIFRYTVQLASYNYELETVLGKTEEIRAFHKLRVSSALQQEWGEIFASLEGIQYLDDPATHRINIFLNLEYRLFRGFNIDIFGRFSRIKDQFYLPAQGLTPAEILVRRRQRETDHRFDIGVGFNYRFGSKYANVVNPRIR